jgi:hypothetical protein
MSMRTFLSLTVLLVLPGAQAYAQRAENAFQLQDTTREIRSDWRPLRIAKWTTFLASGAAAAYGFSQNRVADDEYLKLEMECEESPLSCFKLADTDQYADPAMEQRYQKILKRDEDARFALLAGQIGIAASVVMFIIDLPDRESPEDIPYDPKPVRVGLSRDGGALLQFHLRAF